jgi:RNA recognition motif-containing protein
LTQHFEHYGAVVSAQVSKDFSKKDIQHNSGYGFVEFSTIEGCKKALSLPRQMINGKLCDVREYHWKGSTKVKSEG